MKPIYFNCHYSNGGIDHLVTYRIFYRQDEPSNYKYFLEKESGENVWRHAGAYRSVDYALKGFCVRFYSPIRRTEPFNSIDVHYFKSEVIGNYVMQGINHFSIETDSTITDRNTGETVIQFMDLIVPIKDRMLTQ